MKSSDGKDPVYDVVDEKKATSLSEECLDTGSRYENQWIIFSDVRKSKRSEQRKLYYHNNCQEDISMCLHCFHLVASFLINFVFIVVAFIEISKLKSKETISSSSLQHLIMELNENN